VAGVDFCHYLFLPYKDSYSPVLLPKANTIYLSATSEGSVLPKRAVTSNPTIPGRKTPELTYAIKNPATETAGYLNVRTCFFIFAR
jgi:hypothetical protein